MSAIILSRFPKTDLFPSIVRSEEAGGLDAGAWGVLEGDEVPNVRIGRVQSGFAPPIPMVIGLHFILGWKQVSLYRNNILQITDSIDV